MDSFQLYFKLISFYVLLLGCEFQDSSENYAVANRNGDQISDNEKEHILNYHKTYYENINSEEIGLSQLFPGLSLPQSTATRSVSNVFNNSADSFKSRYSNSEENSNQLQSTVIPSNPIDSSSLSFSKHSKKDNNLSHEKSSLDRIPRSTTLEESVYEWALEDDHEAEAVYYSIYPEYTDPNSAIEQSNFNFRELRSIAEDDLQSFIIVSPVSSESSINLIQPTSTFNSHHLLSTVNEDINQSVLLLPSHNRSTGIDDIINGLVHLLGDNVKVANSTNKLSSTNNSQSDISMRINNRGPPTSVPLLLDDIVMTSSHEFDAAMLNTSIIDVPTTTSKVLVTFVPPTSHEITVKSSVTDGKFTSLFDEIVKSTPVPDGIQSLPTLITDRAELSTTYSITESEIKKQLPATSEIKINSTTMQTQLLSETKVNDFTTTEDFLPTEPIGGWRPVKPFNYPPANPIRTQYTKSTSNPTQSRKQNPPSETTYSQLIPSFHEPERNKFGTTAKPTFTPPLTEEVSLITANEESFGDILLTATGAMNGGGNPTKAIPKPPQTTTSTTESIKHVNNNEESVYIDGRRQYISLVPADETINSGAVENRPKPKPQPVSTKKPNVQKHKQTTTIRIDTCIVGDDTACDGKNHEVCRTEGGVSSCTCPPGLARAKNSNECVGVVSLLLFLRLDQLNGQRLLFDEVYITETLEKEYMKNEAVQGLTSLFRMSSLAPIFIELKFNSFYAIGGKLAANVTIMIQQSPHTSTQLIKQVISRELISTLQQKNHSIGASHLSVDSRFNPIPSIHDLNECVDSEWNDCSVNADCENVFGSFKCHCWPGFTDKFSDDSLKQGRVCTACSPEYCNNHGLCILNEGKQECRCRGSYIGHRCEIDSEVLGVALGASLAALLIIILTFICLCMWSRRWKKDQPKPQIHSASPSFTYMDKTGKAECDLHSLVSDNTLQWFPMRERDSRGNFYSMEPPELSRNPLAIMPMRAPYSSIIRSNLSHSQTKLMSSDDCLIDSHATRFYVPRPKARLRTEYQNIYADPIHDEDMGRGHRPYDGQSIHAFYN